MEILQTASTLEEENILLRQMVHELSAQLRQATEQLNWFKKRLFGQKSERFVEPDGQLYFPGFEPKPEEVAEEKKVPVSAHEKTKRPPCPNTISFPEDLPVEELIIDLSEEEKVDLNTGIPLVCIGEDVSIKLGKRAASYFLKKVIRKKYAIPNKPEEGIKSADLPDGPIPRCAVEESVLADVITKKFCDHLPLYRQSEMLKREQIKISRQTLSSYVMRCGELLKPIYMLLEEEIKASQNIFIDETPVDMLSPGSGKTVQGYMVAMVGGQSLDPSLKLYKFFTSLKHEEFEQVFIGYKGVFHSDKYGAYEKEARVSGKIWCPCWAHIRRKYIEAEGDPSFQKEVLSLIQQLFLIEEKTKDLGCTERMEIRQSQATPIIDSLLEKNQNRLNKGLLPKSKLAIAIGYFQGLSPYVKNYTLHPYARLDNNVAERAIKLVVIGRKNWMFIGNEGGGEASSVLYSLAQTCRSLQINPLHYFEDVLRRIQGHPYSRLSELLPQNWVKS